MNKIKNFFVLALIPLLASCSAQSGNSSSSSDSASSSSSSSESGSSNTSSESTSSESSSSENYPTTIENGSFEEGITGWNIGGSGGFSEEDIANVTTFTDDKASNQVGSYCYAGAYMSLASFTGTLTSDYFTLSNLGVVSLMIGAMKDGDKCYVEVIDLNGNNLDFYVNGGEEKATKLTNADFNGTTITSQLIRNYIDLREHLGETMAIRFVDNDTNSDYTDYSF